MSSKISKFIDKFALVGYFIVAICEFVQGSWFSGVGWCLAGVGWYAFEEERKFFDQANAIYRKCVKEYEDTIEKLKFDLVKKDGEEQPKSGLDSSIINMENMDKLLYWLDEAGIHVKNAWDGFILEQVEHEYRE